MRKPVNCQYCGTPTKKGCPHYIRSIGRGQPSKLELEPIEECEKAYLNKLKFGTYPYCKEHGAMLSMEATGEVWRCVICGLGIKWNRSVGK